MRTRWMLIGSVSVIAGLSAVYAMKRPPAAQPTSHVSAAKDVDLSAPVAPAAPQVQYAPPSAPVAQAPEAPLAPPPVEPQEVLDTMTKAELNEDIAEMEDLLTKRDAIKRLNAGTVSDAERAELGAVIQRLALMKHQVAKIELGDLESAVAEYEKGHAARVAALVHKKK